MREVAVRLVTTQEVMKTAEGITPGTVAVPGEIASAVTTILFKQNSTVVAEVPTSMMCKGILILKKGS